ncbi:uncharacterized protein LOC117174573 isoform X2 [Belonocnema kinseyi]|uniref:uncharacterized protein LOC117174573 isoform X2 n=1 Tax=Belonocnema kinseyi TaxID=2817044 RepID=UPI00143D893A|nr:uncharacterized protein LOC117174573 isoform X2 [Belonocnema kinseyi]XP_033219692.1 uncharacterized protein LOC117174573 isoform X2 [Belonocnema kinseyi]XP_033219693.1 uncharacterized protein LOC117174573 isoform X2 [Belonocnema kinseyi]
MFVRASTSCSPMRSDLKMLLSDGFLPPHFPLRRSELGLRVPESSNMEDKDYFPPLFVRQGINFRPLGKDFPLNPPYDLYCPTLQSALRERTCKECGLYFDAKLHKSIHQTSHKDDVHGNSPSSKTMPVSILKRCEHEDLCIIQEGELAEVFWLDHDEIDENFLALSVVETEKGEGGLEAINSITDWLTDQWTIDDTEKVSYE